MRQLDYIAHHGILGQKWGIRRYQNPDGSFTEEGRKRYGGLNRYSDKDLILAKGQKLQRISDSTMSSHRKDGSLYVSYTPKDNKYYETEFSKELRENMIASGKSRFDNLDVYKLNMSATEAIVSPSERKRINEFISMYENDRIGISSELGKEAVAISLGTGVGGAEKQLGKQQFSNYSKQYAKWFENASGDEIMKSGYQMFTASFYRDTPMRSQYFNNMVKKGYNALVDDNDILQGMECPMILLKGADSIRINSYEKLKI